MRLLDLFSGAGGAAVGYHRAGFDEILGVDINPQPNYPFRFVQADAMSFLDAMIETTEDTAYDLIHASPPCQRYSKQGIHDGREDHPDLVGPVREALQVIGLPYVMENVEGSPLDGATLKLCGSMFGLEVQRHRLFELSFPIMSPACNHKSWRLGRPHTVTGHADGTIRPDSGHSMGFRDHAHAAELMGMPWTTKVSEIVEAIPPVYTQYIGEHFLSLQALHREARVESSHSSRTSTTPRFPWSSTG